MMTDSQQTNNRVSI